MNKLIATIFFCASLQVANASQTALNSQTNSTPVVATTSVLNYSGDSIQNNTHDTVSYGNAVTYAPMDGYTGVSSTQTNLATIESRISSVLYSAPQVMNNSLRAVSYGNLAVLGLDGGSILSSQTTTQTGGVTATTADVFIGYVNTSGDTGSVEVSGNSVLSSAVGNSDSYTITR